MGTDLKKAGQGNKIGVIACGIGAVCSFIWLHWILGIICIVGGVYFFKGLLKDYAASGKRF